MIKIVADIDIPFLKGVLDSYVEINYFKGADINHNIIKDADALIIRTRTICNRELLENTKIKSIYTATIGTDHIDKDYCKNNGIKIYDSAGCNAWGVVQYVISAIFTVYTKNGLSIQDKTIGIIGAGNVGERLAFIFNMLGLNVIRHDPPIVEKLILGEEIISPLGYNRQRSDYYEIDYLLKNSDIISVHVPLSSSTFQMCNNQFFLSIKKRALFINSSRGGIVLDCALKKYRSSLSAVIMDVWNNEPKIDKELLSIVDIATPHIAGYSLEGKANATQISVRNIAKNFNIINLLDFVVQLPSLEDTKFIYNTSLSLEENINSLLFNFFDISKIDKLFRQDFTKFENIRDNYEYRRETPIWVYSYISELLNNMQ